MFSGDIRSLLIQVITSWQVLAVTIVLILYIFLVGYVANTNNRTRGRRASAPRKKAAKPAGPAVAPTEDLGLEESAPTPEKKK